MHAAKDAEARRESAVTALALIIIGLVSAYCAVQAYRDFRRGDRLLAALGVLCVLALWLTPIEGRAIKLDLGGTSVRQAT